MKLLRLKARNVFSLGEVDLPLASRGLVLVTGYSIDDLNENGAGKSSLANHAIVWGLYGQTQDGFKADDVINRHASEKSGYVDISFVGIDDKIYSVRRSRNPNKLTLLQGDVDISHKVERETQKSINKVLGRDFYTFIQSDLIGPGTERSFCRLTVSEQVSIIENLLPIYQLDTWAENAKEARRTVLAQCYELEKKKTKFKANLESQKDNLENLTNQNFMWKSQQAAKINKEREHLNTLLEIQHIKEEKINEKTKIINENLNSIPVQWRDLSKISSTNTSVLMEIGSINEQLKKLGTFSDSEKCPTCSQIISGEIALEADLKIKELNKRYSEINILANNLNEWARMLKTINECSNWINYETSTNKQEHIEKSKSDLSRLENEKPPYEDILKDISASVQSTLNILKNIEEHEVKLNKEYKWLEFWEKGFSSDIKTMMIEEVCPFLENRINNYLVSLNNPQFKAIVSTTKTLKSGDIRDRFTLDVTSENGANSFGLLSVGEKQIISFAVSLALSDLAATQAQGSSDILILDEPFMGLSPKNCENIVNFLMSYNRGTILLISNEDNLKSLVPNRVHVIKEKGISCL